MNVWIYLSFSLYCDFWSNSKIYHDNIYLFTLVDGLRINVHHSEFIIRHLLKHFENISSKSEILWGIFLHHDFFRKYDSILQRLKLWALNCIRQIPVSLILICLLKTMLLLNHGHFQPSQALEAYGLFNFYCKLIHQSGVPQRQKLLFTWSYLVYCHYVTVIFSAGLWSPVYTLVLTCLCQGLIKKLITFKITLFFAKRNLIQILCPLYLFIRKILKEF
jgi:hypothetical protein